MRPDLTTVNETNEDLFVHLYASFSSSDRLLQAKTPLRNYKQSWCIVVRLQMRSFRWHRLHFRPLMTMFLEIRFSHFRHSMLMSTRCE